MTIDKLNGPNLRHVDLSRNSISDPKTVSRFLSRCPRVEHLFLNGNPVSDSLESLAEIAGHGFFLRTINGENLRATDHADALESCKAVKAIQDPRAWRFEVCARAFMRRVSATHFASLVELDLGGCGLAWVHVAQMHSLVRLGLRGNRLESLRGMGLEHAGRIADLDVANNRLDKASIRVFAGMRALIRLKCAGNPGLQEHYPRILYETRASLGTLAFRGLAELDGRPVSVDDRLAALEAHGPASDLPAKRWLYSLRAALGPAAEGDPRGVTRIALAARRLAVVDVSRFNRLVFLDLRNNDLRAIPGLEHLAVLRTILLSGNPKLDSGTVIKQLSYCPLLACVTLVSDLSGGGGGGRGRGGSDSDSGGEGPRGSIVTAAMGVTLVVPAASSARDARGSEATAEGESGPSRRGSVRSRAGSALSLRGSMRKRASSAASEVEGLRKDDRKARRKLLVALLPGHDHLYAVEGVPLTQDERIAAYAQAGGGFHAEPVLRFRLACLVSAVSENSGCLSPSLPSAFLSFAEDALPPGKQYVPGLVATLHGLCGRGLVSSACDFRMFPALRELSIAGNRLETLAGMGLEALKNLAYLDVADNALEMPIMAIGELIDNLPALREIFLEGNPCMRAPGARSNLLASMTCIERMDCHVYVIDTLITLDERCTAWKRRGWDEATAENLRGEAAVEAAALGEPPLTVKALVLAGSRLRTVNLNAFTSLTELDLSRNLLADVASAGIARMQALRTLNLSHNLLEDPAQVMGLASQLASLVNLDTRGNPFAPDPEASTEKQLAKFRVRQLLPLLPRLMREDDPLELLDGAVVELDEILEVFGARLADPEALRFAKETFRARRRMAETGSTTLGLANRGLKVLAFTPALLQGVRTLDLRRNALDATAVSRPGLASPSLLVLALDGNAIKDISAIALAANRCPALEVLQCRGNPCYPDDDGKRMALLSLLDAVAHKTDAPFARLNDQPVTTEERLEAHPHTDQREAFRLDLVCAELGVKDRSVERLVLVDKNLVRVQSNISFFTNLVELNLSNNKIEIIEPGTLDNLDRLTSLDLSFNELKDLAAIFTAVLFLYFFIFLFLFH